jgi:peptidoglycan/LPS O-acetylase OafA/YrhL
MAARPARAEGSKPKEIRREKVFFPNLDGLRFLAFFLVYLQHGFGGAFTLDETQKGITRQLRNAVFESGWAGVSFFFVLSGFLITYLILSEIKVTGRVDVLAFYARRILRIWPLYYLIILFGFFGYPLIKSLFGYSPQIETGSALYYFFFLGNFDVIKLGPGHGAMTTNITWSVAIEEQFYAVWPLIFFTLPTRFYKYAFPVIIILSGVFRFCYVHDGMILYFHSVSVISDMAVGGFTAYAVLNSGRFKSCFSGMSRPLILAGYCLGFSVLVFREYLFAGTVPAVFERLVCSMFFAFILMEQNYCERSLWKLSRLRMVSNLGTYTYGLYLIHPIAILVVISFLKVTLGSATSIIAQFMAGVAGLLLTLIMSYFSYHWVEKRFLALKGRFSHILSGSSSDLPTPILRQVTETTQI